MHFNSCARFTIFTIVLSCVFTINLQGLVADSGTHSQGLSAWLGFALQQIRSIHSIFSSFVVTYACFYVVAGDFLHAFSFISLWKLVAFFSFFFISAANHIFVLFTTTFNWGVPLNVLGWHFTFNYELLFPSTFERVRHS